MTTLNSKVPKGPIKDKWTTYKDHIDLVNPANKRNIDIIVVGTGLAGGSAAATLAELGYNVKAFCYQDSPRRAHSIAAQGGINAAKNYQGDGDSNYRLFYDTVKGGDYRSREANVYRLAEVSGNIIDQCVAQGVPFAREYGGLLDNRSFGGVLVSRTFYAKGQTGQQLLLGAYSAMNRQIARGKIEMFNRHEMLDVVKVDGKARGIIARDLISGEIERHSAHAVVIATGGYGNVYFLSTNAMGSNATAAWKIHKKGAYFANPCYTQIHPTCIPRSGDYQSKLTLMSESLRNDGRIWVPKNIEDAKAIQEENRDYYLERRYPAFGNLVPRDVASRAAKERCDAGYGVNATGEAVYLDFAAAIQRYGVGIIKAKYGNLFQMYEKIVAENPYVTPMMIYPATHYTMGGVWVDYNLMTTVDGLYCIGEANFSDHGMAFERIQQAGGYISVNTSGNTQDANAIPIAKHDADLAMDAATCIGCGACVASCKNSSAMLFVGAKVSQFALLPQGKVEATERVLNMVKQMDEEGFGNCTNTGACEVECPKGISLENIARMNREYLAASLKG
ncbi:UNVERIFIED_CONTAM: hypothetical protein GTU68_025131 [Idotea baltica]|nr:hypothetical protein [Idotea baltica]